MHDFGSLEDVGFGSLTLSWLPVSPNLIGRPVQEGHTVNWCWSFAPSAVPWQLPTPDNVVHLEGESLGLWGEKKLSSSTGLCWALPRSARAQV